MQYKVEDLYDCNYIAFQNSSFGDKWFYAFIDDVTYVNNITSEISYTIDVIQTWITEMDLQQCFVVREHSATDSVGDNLIPEDVETGEMVYVDYPRRLIPDSELRIGVAQASGADGAPVDGGFYGNTFEELNINTNYPATESGAGAVRDLLTELAVLNNQNAVTSIFMCPASILTLLKKQNSASPGGLLVTANERVGLKRSDGTAVKNNKLNTFPYTYMEVNNLGSDLKKYAYEYFASAPQFQIFASIANTVTLTGVPAGYKTSNSLATDFDNAICYTGFPECAWSTSEFANRGIMTMLSGAVGALNGALTGGIAGAVVGGTVGALQGKMSGQIGSTSNIPFQDMPFPSVGAREDLGGARVDRASEITSRGMRAQVETAIALASTPIRPLATSTRMGNSNDLFNGGWWGFAYAQKQPLPQFIDRIDDYFSRYGYKTNRLKVPNISSRPQWNYVQTVGCKIGGSIPCQDEKLICSIFDHGVTFWKHPENVCNYSLDNSPT